MTDRTPTAAEAPGWTREEPTEAGWYWWRQDSSEHAEPVKLHWFGGELWDEDGTWSVDEVSGEWAKIPEPGTAADRGEGEERRCFDEWHSLLGYGGACPTCGKTWKMDGFHTPPTTPEGGEEDRVHARTVELTEAAMDLAREHAVTPDSASWILEKVEELLYDRPSSEGSGGEERDWPHGVDAWLDEIRVILNRGESLSKADQRVLYRLAVGSRRAYDADSHEKGLTVKEYKRLKEKANTAADRGYMRVDPGKRRAIVESTINETLLALGVAVDVDDWPQDEEAWLPYRRTPAPSGEEGEHEAG